MAGIYVDWGGHKLKLTWMEEVMPERELITSVHAFCFHEGQLLMVNLNDRGWDFPGGHIETGETVEACVCREVMEEAYVMGDCTLLGAIEVNHEENPLWNPSSPYPEVGYQVFYRMDITEFLPFDAAFESSERMLIRPEEAAHYHKGWQKGFDEIMETALRVRGLSIRKLQPQETPPYDLLLLADPSRELVNAYIAEGECYIAEEQNDSIGVFVMVPLTNGTVEIKNIAVREDKQGHGIGRKLLQEAIEIAKSNGYKSIEIGTGNSSIGQLALYQKCGFRISDIIKDFFVQYYDEVIMENGIQCKDMILLRMEI